MRLGELLVGEGIVAAAQVETALSRQILHGGRLGSNLVELGFLSMETLSLALGRQHGMPAALQGHFQQIDPALVQMLSPEMAASWHAVPLGRTGPDNKHIAIATTDPFIDDVLHELQAIFDAEIVQAISPELRMLYWLEQIYQIDRINRFKRTQRRDTSDFGGEDTDPERRGYIQTLSDVESVIDINPLARVAVKRMSVPLSGEMQTPIDPSNLEDCCRSVRQATGRRRMGDIVSYVLDEGFDRIFSAGMLLTVREDLAIGWRGFVRGQSEKSVDALAVPLNDQTMFHGPYASGESFFGRPHPSVLDKRLWEFLGSEPGELAILPVEVLGEVACLLYVQCSGPIPAEYAGALGDLSRSISAGLTRLIRAASR